MWRSPWLWVAVLAALLFALIAYSIHQAQVIAERDRQIAEAGKQRSLSDGTEVSGSDVTTPGGVASAAASAGFGAATGADARSHGADLTGVNTATARSDGQNRAGVPSSGSVPRPAPSAPEPQAPSPPPGVQCRNLDPWGYQTRAPYLDVTESFGGGKEQVPVGRVLFSAWEKDPWTLKLSPRSYTAATAVATDDEGKQTVYNRLTIKVDGKTHVIPIETAHFTQTLPDARWRWSGKLYLGVAAGLRVPELGYEVVPAATVSVASYGKTPLMPDWTVGAIGLGYATQARAPAVVLTPVLWNVGKPLPLVDNLYAGFTLAADTRGALSILAGAHVKM